jgi:hypothetical protein
MEQINLSVYGDNILECERMYSLIKEGFPEYSNETHQYDYIFSPLHKISNSDVSIEIQLYPDYKSHNRWGQADILQLLEEKGAKLTEAPDVILTKTISGNETILLAIEFSSAIPAGNQAWQRSGRAISFSEVGISYLYITDIGLEELDSERNSKAIRSSNPLVPLSYIKHSQRSDHFALTVLNPSYLLETTDETKTYLIKEELTQLVRSVVLKENNSFLLEKLEKKIAAYLNSYNKIPTGIDFSKWIMLEDNDIESFVEAFNIKKYNKKIAKKTPTKTEMLSLIKDIVPEVALSIYNNLPICLIPSKNRKQLAEGIISRCYPDLKEDVKAWLKQEKTLVMCLINGFKPRGDDARPDRGLVPFARMLFGNNIDLLTLVFGQAPEEAQKLYSTNPTQLANKNGLWKSVLYYSDLTIADSCHWDLTNEEISCFKLSPNQHHDEKHISFPKPSRVPSRLNENDIDTAIHSMFSTNCNVFESLCNPPGGDWSGISLLDINNVEHRWMSLPRVSIDAKRPDHIFQLDDDGDVYVLIIESKERLSGLTSDMDTLGTGLIRYLTDLIEYPCSAIKKNEKWSKNGQEDFNLKVKKYVSAAAFFYDEEDSLKRAIQELLVDIIIGFNTKTLGLVFKPVTLLGEKIIRVMEKLSIII